MEIKNRNLYNRYKTGLMDTDMAKGEGLFWVSPVDKAALQIFNAINKRKKMAYHEALKACCIHT